MEDKCIECNLSVRPRQQGISCDLCERWQHRTCNSGVSHAEYKRACKGEPLHFICRDCFTPVHQSTALHEDTSIRLSLPFVQPSIYVEASLLDPPVPRDHVEDVAVTFTLIPGGSQKGKNLLVDSHGYSYVLKERRNATTRWRCSVRNKSQVCVAVVTEKGGTYNPATKAHSHPPDATKQVTSAALTKAKTEGVLNPYKSAKTIVVESVRGAGPCVDPINYDQLARRVNRAREATRPEEPTDLNFEQLQRIQRKASRSIQAKLFAAWEEYRAGTLSMSGLLKRCSTFYRPVVPKRPEGS